MFKRFIAGFALALSLLAPASGATDSYEAGDLLVQQRGSGGSAVILIPGLAGGPWVWESTAASLEARYTVYLITPPGFDGRAPRPGATLDSLQRDLLTLIDTRGLGKPAIVGHSLGGALALAFASNYPGRAAGIVSVDGLPVFPGTEHAADRKPLADAMRAQFESLTPEQFLAGMQSYLRQIGVIDPAIADELAPLAARSDARATAEWAAQLMGLDLRPKLPAIREPVVVISPFHAPDLARLGIDEAGKTAYYRGLLAGIQRLDVVSISPARHFPMFDQPEDFARALGSALESLHGNP